MESISVFCYGAQEALSEISKKGTQSDITLHNRKDGDRVITFLEPSRYPEKVSSLTDSIFPSEVALVDGRRMDKFFAEVVVALDLFQKRSGIILVDQYSDTSALGRFLKGTSLEKYQIFSGSPMELVDSIWKVHRRVESPDPVAVVDHSFTVKSVGTVALGFVLSGTITKHHDLSSAYSGRKLQVRSIQMQDADQESAPQGSRVGLALKNISPEELERGELLSERQIDPVSGGQVEMTVHPAAGKFSPDKSEIFLADFMRYQRGTIENSVIRMDSPFHPVGNTFVISRQSVFPRVFSRCRIVE